MSKKQTVTVSNTDDLRFALAAGYEADQIVIAQQSNQEAIASARAEGIAEGKASAQTEAVAAERKRIADLQALARAGFDAELKAAIESGDSPGNFALTLLKAAADRGVTLEAIRKDAPPPATRANPPKPDASGAKAWNDIYAGATPQKM